MAFDSAEWLRQMAANSSPGGKIPAGPTETLAAKPGRKMPTKSKGGNRVPGPEAGQVKKL
jgi:hypothetical protein